MILDKGAIALREETDGWFVLFPLNGHHKADSTMLNPMAINMLSEVEKGVSFTQLVDGLCNRYNDVPSERILGDVRMFATQLLNLGILEMSESECKALFRDIEPRAGMSVMDESEVHEVSAFLTAAEEESGQPGILYSMLPLNTDNISPFGVRSLHLMSYRVVLLSRGDDGELSGVVGLGPIARPGGTVMVNLIAVRSGQDSDGIALAKQTLAQLEQVVVPLLSPRKLRVQVASCKKPEGEAAQSRHQPKFHEQVLMPALAHGGYRREAFLPDELGEGVDLVYYTKTLVSQA